MKIGALAKQANISKRTIDYYTNMGLLTTERTSESGHRLYSSENLEILKIITFCKEKNMSLNEIKTKIHLLNHQTVSIDCFKKIENILVHIQELEIDMKRLNHLDNNLLTQDKVQGSFLEVSRQLHTLQKLLG